MAPLLDRGEFSVYPVLATRPHGCAAEAQRSFVVSLPPHRLPNGPHRPPCHGAPPLPDTPSDGPTGASLHARTPARATNVTPPVSHSPVLARRVRECAPDAQRSVPEVDSLARHNTCCHAHLLVERRNALKRPEDRTRIQILMT